MSNSTASARVIRYLSFVLLSLSTTVREAGAQPFYIYTPPPAEQQTDWAQLLGDKDKTAPPVSAELNAALRAYQADPRMGTAIDVLRHYKEMSGNRKLRVVFFEANKELFQTLDAAKYELVMQTQRKLKKDGKPIGYSWRVGSSGARHQEWLKWKRGEIPDMPPLDVDKQFQSDDDVTNFLNPRAGDRFDERELINGAEAATAFETVTDGYNPPHGSLHPEKAMIEFLSPTKAYPVVKQHIPGEWSSDYEAPSYLQAWVSSDKEKYNGDWAVTQLEHWAYDIGVVTTEFGEPGASDSPVSAGVTTDYKNKYADLSPEGRNGPPKWPADDLFGWMSNQHRQVFDTHAQNLADGEIKYLQKYTIKRMMVAWENLGLTLPPGYSEGAMTQQQLLDFNRAMLVEAHRSNVEILATRLGNAIRNAPDEVGTDGTRDLDHHVDVDVTDPATALGKAANALAIAYSNLDPETLAELDTHLESIIRQAAASTEGDDQYHANLASYLRNTLERTRQAGTNLRDQAVAFRYARNTLGERLNEHLADISGKTMDAFLVDVAVGRKYARDPAGVQYERALQPQDVAEDLRVIEGLATFFGWSDRDMAVKVHDYFNQDLDIGIQMLQRLHRITSGRAMQPRTIQYKDADGNVVRRTILPSRFSERVSFGLLSFKAALKYGYSTLEYGKAGWDIYGKVQSGAELFQNLSKIAGPGLSDEEVGRAHAQILTGTMGLAHVADHIKKTYGSGYGFGADVAEKILSLSTTPVLDDEALTMFALNFAKDLIASYYPPLAVFSFVYDASTTLYGKVATYNSRERIVDFIVENGEWDVDLKGAKDPVLKGIYLFDGSAKTLYSDPTVLAKRLRDPRYAGGYHFLETRDARIDPRADLLNIARRNGALDGFEPLQIVKDAIENSLWGWKFWQWAVSGQDDWTEEYVRETLKVGVDPMKEDLKELVPFEPVDLIDDGDKISRNVRRNTAKMISEFWAWQQQIIEEKVLPEMIKLAIQRKLQEVMEDMPELVLLDEVKLLDGRMIELDKKVWSAIARSADPYPGKDYTDTTDINITSFYRTDANLGTRYERQALKDLDGWIRGWPKDQAAKDAYPPLELSMGPPQAGLDAPGDLSTSPTSVTVRDLEQARRVGQVILKDMTRKLQEIEGLYDKVLTDAGGLARSVAGGDPAQAFDISPYHLRLQGSMSGLLTPGDVSVTDDWAGQYKEERKRVRNDIWARNPGLVTPGDDRNPVAPAIGNATAQGAALNAMLEWSRQWAESIRQRWFENYFKNLDDTETHPYFPYLTRLRYQIRKLEFMSAGTGEMTPEELAYAVSQMQLDKKPVTIGAGGDPAGTIASLKGEMEKEYRSIIANLFNLVGVTLTVPDVERKLLGKYKVSAAVHVKDAPSLTAEEIGNFITGYRWTIVSHDEIVYNVTTRTPEIELPLIHSGPTHVQVEPVTAGGLPLGYANAPFIVDPVKVEGNLEITGTLPDPRLSVLVLLGSNRYIVATSRTSIAISKELTEISYQDLLDLGIIDRLPTGETTRHSFQAVAQTSDIPPMMGDPVDVTASPGLLTLVEPARIDLEGGVAVNVQVVDLTGVPVPDAEVTVSDNRGNAVSTPANLTLPLLVGSTVSAVARLRDPDVEATSDPTTYDSSRPFDIKITLPIFMPGSLNLTGTVVPPAGEAPPIQIAGGEIATGTVAVPVVEGGAFTYTNGEIVDAQQALQFDRISLRADNHRLIRATTIPFPVALELQPEQNPVEIETETFEVAVDPIPIAALDWTRQPILDNQRMTVTVEGRPAAKEPNVFHGSHKFRFDNEEVTLAAEWVIPEGRIKGESQLSISAVKNWETKPVLDDVQEIVLPVYLPGNVALEGEIVEGADPLTDIHMTFPQLGRRTPIVQSGPFTVVPTFPLPRRAPLTIGIEALAGDHREANTKDIAGQDENGVINAGVFDFGPLTAGANHDEQVRLLGERFEKERDAAILACDYENAAAAQRSLVDAVNTYLGDHFGMTVPVGLEAQQAAFRSDLTNLEKAATAELAAKEAMKEASTSARNKDWEAAAQQLTSASSIVDLPSCTQEKLAAALRIVDAKLAEYEAKISEVVAKVNACELKEALALADPIAQEVPLLSWVQEEYPKVRDLAKKDGEMLTVLARARQAENEGEALAQSDARAAILKFNAAIDIVADARRDAPDCRQQSLAAYEAHLHARATAIAGGQPAPTDAAGSATVDRSLLLVIDVSGSMRDQNKIDYAKSAAISTVRSLGPNVEVGLVAYSGGCSPGGRVVQGLTTDKAAVVSAVQGLNPGGGTPMAPAINFARDYLEKNAGSRAGQMIVLSDGQNDCGSVSDAGSGVGRSSMNIKLDAVGLGLAEGSQADKDLQDLVRSSGGTQYSASNSEELVRAFRRASVFDQVKWDDPYVDPAVQASLQNLFQIAAAHLKDNDYAGASAAFKQAVDRYPQSPSAHHNYSLALEADGQLVGAVQEGERYLDLAPNAFDAGAVRARIDELRREVAENPRAIFSPNLCTDLYQWARDESNRVRDASRKAQVFRIMTAAQRGDCPAATKEYEAYTVGQ